MSNYVTISFCEVKDKADAFDKALSVIRYFQTKKGIEEHMKLIARGFYYDKELLENSRLLEDKMYKCLNFKFIYFKKKNLLGCIGDFMYDTNGDFKKDFSTSIFFQDSTDQDYDYSVWSGITFFEKIVEKYKNASLEVLLDFFKEWEQEDIEEDLEYCRRSLVYQKIYKELDIASWFDRNINKQYSNENYDSFALSAIDNIYDAFEAKRFLVLQIRSLIGRDELSFSNDS